MSLVYGDYNLDMNCAEYDILLQSLREMAMKSLVNTMGGMKIYSLAEFKSNGVVGFSLIGDDNKQAFIGVCYRTSDLSRIWFVPTADDRHTMFIDGSPDIVENMGLIYEEHTKNIISPANDNKIILTL